MVQIKFKTKTITTVVIVVILALLAYSIGYQQPQKRFVVNQTFETHSDLFFNYEMTEYPSSAEVSSAVPVNNTVTIGVVVDPWNLNFGIIPQGNNYGTRFVDLGNMKENDAKVSFKIYGTIAPFVTFSKNNFMLHSKENTTVQLNFNASTAQIGNYTGQIDVVVQRPKYDFVYSFWS